MNENEKKGKKGEIEGLRLRRNEMKGKKGSKAKMEEGGGIEAKEK